MAEDDDSGLPEEAAGKLEQTNAVPVNERGPYFKPKVSNRQIFENIDDLYEYGTDIIYGRGSPARRASTVFVVVDNSDQADILYPNQPHYWFAERLPPDPSYVGDDENFRGDVYLKPLYEKMVELAEEGMRGYPRPSGSIIAGQYRGVDVYLPDPTKDYSRPGSQTESTTGATTGTTVETTTTVTPGSAGAVTTSETIPADVGLDAFGGAGAPVSRTDPLDAFGGAGAPVPSSVTGDRGNGAAEVAARRAQSAVASRNASSVQTGTTPCLPTNPPASTGTSGSGATPPASVPYDDAILRQARAAAAAPASVIPDPLDAFGGAGAAVQSGSIGGRGNGAAEVAARRAAAAASTVTAPTTVTSPPSTPTSSATASPRPPNVYIYEALTPGFDRYDFNSGKKVYTPNTGPSRNSVSQTNTPASTPRVPSTVNTSTESAVAAGFGDSRYGEFGPPVNRTSAGPGGNGGV